MSFPGRHGSVIYLQNYLSTMFQISDVMIDKEEVAMILNIKLELPDNSDSDETESVPEHEVIVSKELSSVSKTHIEIIIRQIAKILSERILKRLAISRFRDNFILKGGSADLVDHASRKSFFKEKRRP